MAAQADRIGLISADSGRAAKQVAPFGGREARIGTNPLSIAVPSNLDGPLFLDMATSAVAAGETSQAGPGGGADSPGGAGASARHPADHAPRARTGVGRV